jgi:outer membrane protein assembly factor BamB
MRLACSILLAHLLQGQDWPRFRGPNGTGVSETRNLPAEFGPGKHLLWRAPLGKGHSSPVVARDRVYVTAEEQEKLFTLCLRLADGKLLWKRESPRSRREALDRRNNAASPTPAADENGVFVFFPDYGLLHYTRGGVETWRLPLGPFDNFYGMGASPILAGDNIVLVCDQKRASFIMAVGKSDGKTRWKQPRPEAVSGHSTPVLWRESGGPLAVIAPGSFRMDAYQAQTGEPLWFVRGLASEMKSVPVAANGVIYINGYNLPENDPGRQIAVPPFAEMLGGDRNKDGVLERDELPEGRAKQFFPYLDLDHSGKLDESEWRLFSQSLAAENGLLAIRAGGRGDVTATHTQWKFHRSIPQLPSALLYEGVLYMVNDNGILTTLDPATGAPHKQARLRNASDRVFASPVAADGKVYFVTESGVVIVKKPGAEQETLAVNDLGEDVYATPAIAAERILIRSAATLWAFGLAGSNRQRE